MLKVHISGASQINSVLRRLPDRVQKQELQKSLRAGGNIIRDAAQALAPVDTGEGRDSIKVTAVRGNSAKMVRLVVNTGKAFYLNFIEFGTRHMRARPFMRPAFDETAGQALQKIGHTLGKGVEKQAATLAGPYAKARRSFGLK